MDEMDLGSVGVGRLRECCSTLFLLLLYSLFFYSGTDMRVGFHKALVFLFNDPKIHCLLDVFASGLGCFRDTLSASAFRGGPEGISMKNTVCRSSLHIITILIPQDG